jgi:putative addiction module component (TIGR02574 family)
MYTQLEVVEGEALKLTVSERASLAQRLLASLDEDAEIEESWASEVEHRVAAVERGDVRDIPMGEAIARLRAGLK